MVSLWVYLVLAAALFSIGAFGVLARRNAIAILMGVELMLNAVNINLVAFWRFVRPDGGSENMFGQVFTVFVFVVAAAEVAVGLAIIISVYRSKRSVIAEEVDLLKW
ncbi:MAG: NADH-quinone oxidoreductase subunit NuoK [Chloroflexi bacterium]|nr:MAG: NADH-quinone oxidoreductase subunit NuoK [Phototrophicales bacterium]RMF79430.1 MAG: NADH-quinone oxidoreductase subunit NuoK [Chloroflexota bacterium]